MLGLKSKEVSVEEYFEGLVTKLDKIEGIAATLAELEGTLTAATEVSVYIDEIAELRLKKADAELDLENLREAHSRETREIEHKLGLHKKQIDSERGIMIKEAEANSLVAVEQAKLEVEKGNLGAERKRFEQEIEFRTKRFEEEAATLRDLTGQILARLPNVTASFTHNVSDTPEPKKALPRGKK